ncbi:MAG: serine hydrolase [Acidobacteria bacterium]|nr:serine hydrolase [Acidobacteriota bacterium]
MEVSGIVVEWLLAAMCVAAAAVPANGQTVFPGADWQEVSPDSQGVDSAKLKAAVAWLDANFGPQGAQELVVIRNGRLIWKSAQSGAYHNIWSSTKNFTSTALGLMVADRKCTLDDLAVNHLPALAERDPAYSKIKLRHLASMSSGYRGELVNVTREQPWGEPLFYLNPVAPFFEPGTKVQYQDHQVFVLGAIVTQLAGESLKALFARRIANPIGMTQWDWGVSGKLKGIDLNNAAGTPTTPGIQTNALQLARFGLLYLNRGEWNGKQLLPASFVDQATANQVAGAGASAFLHGRYGFYWWTNDVRPDGTRPWPSAPPKAYTSHGNGSNFCFVVPEWNMVVVRTGTIPFGSATQRPNRQDLAWDGFFARVGEALGRVRSSP